MWISVLVGTKCAFVARIACVRIVSYQARLVTVFSISYAKHYATPNYIFLLVMLCILLSGYL